MNAALTASLQWQNVCHRKDLVPHSGIAVMLGKEPVAIFWLPGHDTELYAIGHTDPFSGSEVLAHGILCESQGVWSVASPLYKQHFRLDTGRCIETPDVGVDVWAVRIEQDWVQIGKVLIG